MMSHYDQFRRAEDLFAHRDYLAAARVLEGLLADLESDPEGAGHGLGDARMLLTRSYYHSARLGRAEQGARAILEDDPSDAYAALLLARSLQRASRPEEASGVLALAEAMGLSA